MSETEFHEYLDASLRVLGVDPGVQASVSAEIPPADRQGELTDHEQAILRRLGWAG